MIILLVVIALELAYLGVLETLRYLRPQSPIITHIWHR
jgi:hypothetical protein